MIKAVIFDCFGVIISDALQIIVDEFSQQDAAGAEEIRDLVRASNRGIIDPQESNLRIAEILGVELEVYRQRIQDGELKDQRVLDLIKQLRKDYMTAMLSNINVPGLDRRFTEEEKTEYFDVIVASAGIGHAKPEAEAYEITAEKLGVLPNECVFIDDREDFCEAAKATGMQAIWYQSFEQAKADLEKLLA